MRKKYDSKVSSAFAVKALPFFSLEGFYVSPEWILLKLSDAAGDLAACFGRQILNERLGVFCDPNDPVHVSRPATA
jgi:hypothetical protein